MVIDLARDLGSVLVLDAHLEDVAAGRAVVALVVTSLNNELHGLADCEVPEETVTESEGLVRTRVQEVAVAHASGGKLVAEDSKLNGALLGSELLKVRRDGSELGIAHEGAGSLTGELSGSVNNILSDGEVDFRGLITEANTLDSHGDATGQLAEGRVDLHDGVAGTNDLVHSQGPHIVEPTIVPATEDEETAVGRVVGAGSVLTSGGNLIALGLDLLPLHGANIEEAGAVDIGAKGTLLAFSEVGALTTEDEVLPGGDSLNHDGTVVPAGHVIVDVGVGPLKSVQVENDNVVELRLTVPSTVRVELILESEQGVTTAAGGEHSVGRNDGLVLLPDLGGDVKGVDIVQGDASVVQTTVTTVDPDLVVVVAGTGVRTGSGRVDGALLVLLSDGLVTLDALPREVMDSEPPAVVKTLGWGLVSTEDEDAIVLGRGDGDVLGTGRGQIVANGLLLFPAGLLCDRKRGLGIRGWTLEN